MEHIVKSLTAMTLAVAAAVVFMLGTAFLVASDATLSGSTLGASVDLGQAARWLQFLAAAAALAAVCIAGWQVVLRSEWIAAMEIAAGALGTLLITIGTLSVAASNNAEPSAEVIGAVGFGVWALLVLSRAARTSLAEQGSRGGLAELWLAAAAGLFVFAIGYGLTSAADSQGAAVAAGLLEAIGGAALAGSLVVARSRGHLHSRPATGALAGLALLATSFLATAIVVAIGIGTLTALGAALAVTAAIELAAVAALGLAAWTRVAELHR